MKPELTALIRDKILTTAASRFDLDSNCLKSLDGFENYVCESNQNGRPVVLRISHPVRRTVNQIQAELEFISHSADKGVAVARPVLSTANNLIEEIHSHETSFVVACFEKASGELVARNNMTDKMLFNRGCLIGQIHKHSLTYVPSSPEIKRFDWFEEDDFANSRSYLPPEEAVVSERLAETTDELIKFGRSEKTWGLIHFDAHHGNMLFDNSQPTIFDFDDSAYDLFVSDLAIPLFYHVLMLKEGQSEQEHAGNYLNHVLRGYRTEFDLDPRWPEIFPLVLKRREIVLYVAVHRGMDIYNLDEWGTNYINGRKEKIVNRMPYLDLDFSDFANTLDP